MYFRLTTIFLTLWAVFSLVTWGYGYWVELRFMPLPLGHTLCILWSLSLPAYALYRGAAPPRIKHRTRILRLLLLPTGLLLLVLLASTAHYYSLLLHQQWEGKWVPITLLGFGLLGFWAWQAWQHARVSSQQSVLTAPTHPIFNGFNIAGTLISLIACAWFFLGQFRSNPPPPPPAPVIDVAVVLGNQVDLESNPSQILKDRIAGVAQLYFQGRVRKIILSGGTYQFDQRTVSEPLGMKREAVRLGIPEDKLILDPLGINTRATVVNTLRIMKKLHYTSVVAISNDFHLPRLRQAFAAEGVSAYTYACPTKNWSPVDPLWLSREVVGNLVYRFFPSYRQNEVIRLNVAAPRIVVYKSAHKLELYDGSKLIRTYPCITGKNPGDKFVEGDRKTPEGIFHIVVKNPESKYHVSLGLDYPTRAMAEHYLLDKTITKEEYQRIIHGYNTTGIPDWKTSLGGEIFLHGHADDRLDTLGCVALANHDIEELYAVCEVGTEVEIKP